MPLLILLALWATDQAAKLAPMHVHGEGFHLDVRYDENTRVHMGNTTGWPISSTDAPLLSATAGCN
jgi:hypothetical protein